VTAPTYDRQHARVGVIELPSWRVGRDRLFLAGLLVAAMALGLFSLMRTPPPFVDEAWYASRAWAFIHTGRAFGTLDAGVFDNYDGYWTYFPWLGTLLHTLAIEALGLSLFSVRFASLVFGLVLLIAIYAIANHVAGARAGLLAVLLVSLSRPFLYSSHLARQDIMVAAFGFVAVALYITDRVSTWSVKSLLAGLAVGLAFEIHPNAMIYGPAIVAVSLFEHGWSVARARRFWGFIVGVCGGLAFYAAMHILPYPRTYVALSGLMFSSTHTPPLFVWDAQAWLESLVFDVDAAYVADVRIPLVVGAVVVLAYGRATSDRMLVLLFGVLAAMFLAPNPPSKLLSSILIYPTVLAIATAAIVLRARPSSDKRLVSLIILCTVLVLGFLVLIRTKHFYYAILISPVADLLLAVFLARLSLATSSRSLWGYGKIVLIGGLLATATILNLAALRRDPTDDYHATLERVTQVIPPGSSVMGPQTYWFGLPDQRYLSWQQLVYYQRHAPGSTLGDAFQALRPDFLIVDPFMEIFISDDKVRMTQYGQFLHLSRTDLQRFLDTYAQLISTQVTDTFGTVRIYHIDWNRHVEEADVDRLGQQAQSSGRDGEKLAIPRSQARSEVNQRHP
jgi:4-amino-4-deoxy-L-arabinose transferase-like glycosyltransferase